MAILVISYSRIDRPQVRAIVSLLKAALKSVQEAVFWDGDLEPGELWFEQIKQHIDAAPELYVFWCLHSSGSSQVRREFLYALEHHKLIVPVLLDNTPLASELATIHGLDLRGTVSHGPPAFDDWLETAAGQLPASYPARASPRTSVRRRAASPDMVFTMAAPARSDRVQRIRRCLRSVDWRAITVVSGVVALAVLSVIADRLLVLPLYANVLLLAMLVGALLWWERRQRRRPPPRRAGGPFVSYRMTHRNNLEWRQDSDRFWEYGPTDGPISTHGGSILLLDRDRIVREFARHLGDKL